MVHDLVVGRAQDLVAGVRPEAAHVDERLRVLDAEPDRERLGLDVHAAVVQHLERVARAVADGHHEVAGRQRFTRVQFHAHDLARVAFAFDQHVFDARLEADFATQGEDFGTNLLDHLDEAERADVRLADVQDFFRRARLHELIQHLAAVVLRILDLAVQLAVREGAGAAFAELHVRLRVQLALAPEAERVDGALAHDLAAFQHERLEAHLRQDQRHEQAARTHADDHGPRRARRREVLRHELVAGVGGGADVRIVRQPGQHGRLVAHGHVERIDQDDRALLARVVAAFVDGEVDQVVAGDAKPADDGVAQGVVRVIQGKFEFVNSQHDDGEAGARRRRTAPSRQRQIGTGASISHRAWPPAEGCLRPLRAKPYFPHRCCGEATCAMGFDSNWQLEMWCAGFAFYQ